MQERFDIEHSPANVTARLSPFRLETLAAYRATAQRLEITDLVSWLKGGSSANRAWIDGIEVPVEMLSRVRPQATALELAGCAWRQYRRRKDARLRAILTS